MPFGTPSFVNAPVLFVVYLVPFVVLGLFWVKVLRRRRALVRGDVRPPVH